MRRIKQQFKLLRIIAPDASQKEHFRRILQSKITRESRALPACGMLIRMARNMRTAPALALAIIITLVGSGSGVSYAAQNAIPGETLYRVKLVTERARVAVTQDTKAKAELHLQFASRRLYEIERLIEQNGGAQAAISETLMRYEDELDEGEVLAMQDPILAQDITSIIGETTESHKRILERVAEKAHEKSLDNDLNDEFDNAYEHAESKDDNILFTALSATSTSNTVLSATIIEKSRKKWKSIEYKKKEVESNLKRFISENNRDETLTEADIALDNAQMSIKEARVRWEDGKYREALEYSLESRSLVKEAEKI